MARCRGIAVRGPPPSSCRLSSSPRGDLAGGEGLDPGGSQLHSERQPVDAGADGRHVGLHAGQGESRVAESGALGEQPAGICGGEARNPVDGLARHAECLSAGRQRDQVFAAGEHAMGQVGNGVEDVFAGVQAQDARARLEVADEPVDRVGVGLDPDAQRLRDRARNQGGIGHRPEVDPPHLVDGALELVAQARGQTRLAAAAFTGECHEPVLGDPLAQLRHLVVATHEAGEGQGQGGAPCPWFSSRRPGPRRTGRQRFVSLLCHGAFRSGTALRSGTAPGVSVPGHP